MNEKLKILTIDDEPLARRRIRALLADEPRVGSFAEAADAVEGFEKIAEERPDLIYLDIQMPGGGGFGLLERLRDELDAPLPYVIFVTAYDEFALRAFEFHALDYLLKPFETARFRAAFEHAAERLAAAGRDDLQSGLRALAESLRPPSETERLEWVSVRKDDRMLLFRLDEIRWIEAQGNYALLQLKEIRHLLREKMDVLEARLDREKFLRVHRSAIVNVDFIEEIEVWGRGEYKIAMRGGRVFGVSRRYRANFDDFFRRKVL